MWKVRKVNKITMSNFRFFFGYPTCSRFQLIFISQIWLTITLVFSSLFLKYRLKRCLQIFWIEMLLKHIHWLVNLLKTRNNSCRPCRFWDVLSFMGVLIRLLCSVALSDAYSVFPPLPLLGRVDPVPIVAKEELMGFGRMQMEVSWFVLY